MTTETFPYLTSLHVNDCYTYRDFDIPIGKGVDKPFRHLILTGKNGSGKTTVLQGINDWVTKNNDLLQNGWYGDNLPTSIILTKFDEKKAHFRSSPFYVNGQESMIYAFFSAQRGLHFEEASSPTLDAAFDSMVIRQRTSPLPSLLKLFLINRKVGEAFAQNSNDKSTLETHKKFFEGIIKAFRWIFGEEGLEMTFDPSHYEFYFKYPDGRRFTLNQFPAGYASLTSIVLELLVRSYRVQARQKDFSSLPPGLVLIDEPETHLHLEMQYQVMPLLTSLFPNVQFIVATHSPAVASSIKDATVFDLTTKEVAKDWVVGSSYSELMQTHFGVENEFSNIADEIMVQAQQIVDSSKEPRLKLADLRKLFDKNERYLSPGLHLAMESTVLQPEGGYLDPCDENDDVEHEILYALSMDGEMPAFEARDKSNQKAVNTAKLLEPLHNGQGAEAHQNTKYLRNLIRKKYTDTLNATIEWQGIDGQDKFQAETELRKLLSCRGFFTSLIRPVPAVRRRVPLEFSD